jgi:hypothetical protein
MYEFIINSRQNYISQWKRIQYNINAYNRLSADIWTIDCGTVWSASKRPLNGTGEPFPGHRVKPNSVRKNWWRHDGWPEARDELTKRSRAYRPHASWIAENWCGKYPLVSLHLIYVSTVSLFAWISIKFNYFILPDFLWSVWLCPLRQISCVKFVYYSEGINFKSALISWILMLLVLQQCSTSCNSTSVFSLSFCITIFYYFTMIYSHLYWV